jgi:hypothetical protein
MSADYTEVLAMIERRVAECQTQAMGAGDNMDAWAWAARKAEAANILGRIKRMIGEAK